MHKIIKPGGITSQEARETYCFPDIVPAPGQMDINGTQESHLPFQRIFTDSMPGTNGGAAYGEFVKILSVAPPEAADPQETIDEMVRQFQQIEADALQKGIQTGREEGWKAGYAEGTQEIASVVLSLKQAMQAFDKFRRELCLQAEKETVQLSLAIARKILNQEPGVNPRVIAGVAKKTFESIAVHAPVRIRINPSERAYLQDRRHMIPLEGDMEFIEDPAISCGGCVVESLAGDVDARIESQFEMIEEAFSSALNKVDRDLEALA